MITPVVWAFCSTLGDQKEKYIFKDLLRKEQAQRTLELYL